MLFTLGRIRYFHLMLPSLFKVNEIHTTGNATQRYEIEQLVKFLHVEIIRIIHI